MKKSVYLRVTSMRPISNVNFLCAHVAEITSFFYFKPLKRAVLFLILALLYILHSIVVPVESHADPASKTVVRTVSGQGSDTIRAIILRGKAATLARSTSLNTPDNRKFRKIPLLKPPQQTKGVIGSSVPMPSIVGSMAKKRISSSLPLTPMPSASKSFKGLSLYDLCSGTYCGSGWPPDANGDVSENYYIQGVNSSYAIYNKSTTSLLSSFTEKTLWSGAGGYCESDPVGDPVVLYDAKNKHWILTHMAFSYSSSSGPYYQCMAISEKENPLSGAWKLVAFRADMGGSNLPQTGWMNDYPKFGIWDSCLYMSANEFKNASEFKGVSVFSFSLKDLYDFNRSDLTWSAALLPSAASVVPSNLSGKTYLNLPENTPNYLVSESTTSWSFDIWKFAPGVNCGSGGSITGPYQVSQTSYQSVYPYPAAQYGSNIKLDVIDDRIMQKVQYRKLNSVESLWVVHNVGVVGGKVGLQWAQIDVSGKEVATTPLQQGIYAPDPSTWYWMGSLAVDASGDIAIGYSTSSGLTYPDIRYVGRLKEDSINTLPQTENILVNGGGAQNYSGVDRWGDYTGMSIDPDDDCTFWYTNEYYESVSNGNNGNWSTRIGSFKFPACSSQVKISLTSTPTSQLAGSNVKLTAKLNGGYSPSGDVIFKDGAAIIGTVKITGDQASITTGALNAGNHNFYATFSGDSNNASQTSDACVVNIAKAILSSSLSSVPNPSNFGQTVTMSASYAGGVSPSGSVMFKDGSTTLGTALLSGGKATLMTSALTVGAHTLTAVYAGDENNSESTSSGITQNVAKSTTTSALSSSILSSNYGQSVTFTATISGGSKPSGNVSFKDGSNTLGSGTLSGGVATFTTSSLTVGAHTITAIYGGDVNNSASTSNNIIQTVINKASTITTLTSSNLISKFGQAVTFRATISGGNNPSGSVTFKDGSTPIGIGTLSARATTLTTSALSAGTHTITAVYGGNTNNNSSTSARILQNVLKVAASISLTSNGNPSKYKQSVTFSARVAGKNPTGLIIFRDGTAIIGQKSLVNSLASFSTAVLSRGIHKITAAYSGDNNNTGIASSLLIQTVK